MKNALIAALVALLVSSASAGAATVITSARIKDGTVAERDLSKAVKRKLNAKRFESVSGPAGGRGADGAAGGTGAAGQAGRDGLNGTDGRNGVDGQPGADGPAGPTDPRAACMDPASGLDPQPVLCSSLPSQP